MYLAMQWCDDDFWRSTERCPDWILYYDDQNGYDIYTLVFVAILTMQYLSVIKFLYHRRDLSKGVDVAN